MSYVDQIAQAMRDVGNARARGVAANGQAWGGTVADMGALASHAYQQQQAQQIAQQEAQLRAAQLAESQVNTANATASGKRAADEWDQKKLALHGERMGNILNAAVQAPEGSSARAALLGTYRQLAAEAPDTHQVPLPPSDDTATLSSYADAMLGPEETVNVPGVGAVGKRSRRVLVPEPIKVIERDPLKDLVNGGTGAVITPGIAAPPKPETRSIDVQAADALAKGDTATYKRLLQTKRDLEAAGRAPNPDAVPPAVMANPGINGADYLKTLPAGEASTVKALAEGRMQFPGSFALKTPYWQNILKQVGQYDPTFDAINYNSRSKTRADFTSGKTAQNINALNTVVGHLADLSDKADALGNGNYQTLNALKNWIKTKTGSSDVTNFDTVKKAVGDELTRVWRQAGGTEADTKQWQDSIGAANSPEQLNGAIATIGGLLESKLTALKEQYRQGMGIADIETIAPQSRAALTKLEQRRAGQKGGATKIGRFDVVVGD